MTDRLVAAMVAILLVAGYAPPGTAQGGASAAGAAYGFDVAGLPEGAYRTVETLNVRDMDVRDLLRGLAHAYELNLVVDNRIDRRATLRLAGMPVLEVVAFLCREHGLVLERQGAILRVGLPPAAPPPSPPPPRVEVRDGLLTVDLRGEDVHEVVRALTEAGGPNVLVHQGVRGPVHGQLRGVPLEVGLRTLLQSNGFAARAADGIFRVDRALLTRDAGAPGETAGPPTGPPTGSPAGVPPGGYWVQVRDSTVTLDVADAPKADVLREVAAQFDANLVTYQLPEGSITARVQGLSLEACLAFLLQGTSVTFRREGDVYYVGAKQSSGIASTRLVRLDHLRADGVLELLPAPLREAAGIQVVREHNGLMVTGAHDEIEALEAYVRAIDHPTPQILIEALVVDFEAVDLFELGIRLGRGVAGAGDPVGEALRFDTDGEAGGGLTLSADAAAVNGYLDGLARMTSLFGIRQIGRLPDDFYLRIQALSREGKADIRSRPQIATLNGHTASLSIGTTQYYILQTNTPYQTPGQIYVQETERFEKIEANVKLEITPWVSATGEVTTEIRPEFSAPVGELDPEVPPTINSRVLESTVRLRDGETIILGGLIQDVVEADDHRVPVLGSVPMVGRLFRGRSREMRKSELVIFLTPHVFYGDGRDDARWQGLRDGMELEMDRRRHVGYTEMDR